MGIFRGSDLSSVISPRKRVESVGSKKQDFQALKWFEGASPTAGARGTQDCVEPVLVREARERGGNLRFYTECVGFEQDGEGVSITLKDRESGKEETVKADYMIAADGANSPVRRQLGVKCTPDRPLGNLLNILFHADLKELVRGREFSLCLIERPEQRGVITSINNKDRWVYHLSYDPAKGEKPEDYPPEQCIELLHLALGMPDVKIEIKSILPWVCMERVVEKLQQGRIFLAGDAAHTMTPYRGQGTNSGIADVHNLA